MYAIARHSQNQAGWLLSRQKTAGFPAVCAQSQTNCSSYSGHGTAIAASYWCMKGWNQMWLHAAVLYSLQSLPFCFSAFQSKWNKQSICWAWRIENTSLALNVNFPNKSRSQQGNCFTKMPLQIHTARSGGEKKRAELWEDHHYRKSLTWILGSAVWKSSLKVKMNQKHQNNSGTAN